MDGASLVAELETNLSDFDRFERSTILLALTDGGITSNRLIEAAATSEYAAVETFQQWIETEQHNSVKKTFENISTQEMNHYNRLLEHLDDPDPSSTPGPIHSFLRARSNTIARTASGLLARPLVSLWTYDQIIPYFRTMNQEQLVELFSDLKTETHQQLAPGRELLDDLCTTPQQWTTAESTSKYVIQLAYDTYEDRYR